ncbi:MAG: class I SAM-dependent rRNA methyltransferase [Gammaproteobacteria bacterium]|nr:class I SAM-dependent rRNA methyltransferase [Gammaproteobacteria bacterium]
MSKSSLPVLRLAKGAERRIKLGHLWIYSNEVDTAATPLRPFTPGQLVNVESHQGRPLGSAYLNPHSLICARLYSRQAHHPLDGDLLRRRLQHALSLREDLYPAAYYRACFAESDFIPGLVIDRFGDYLSVQISTAGLEHYKALLLQIVVDQFKPRGVILRNDAPIRELEQLPLYSEVVYGEIPEVVVVEENGARFNISLHHGQKTGWFYDHRDNRARLQQLCHGKRVLDVFSYLGAWGIEALLAGARELYSVDSSAPALAQLRANTIINQVETRAVEKSGDAFEVLQALVEEKQRFDIVIVDPPAFVKRRKDLAQGLHAYQRINHLALQLLAHQGLLVTASCSQHVEAAVLLGEVRQAAKHLPLRLQVIAQGHQAADHPVHPAMPETDYLKCFICRVIRE